MSLLTQYNTYTFETFGHRGTTSETAVFSPDDNVRYIVKSIRATHLTGGNVILTTTFYSGADDASYVISTAELGNSESLEIIPSSPIVISGDLGDELRAETDTADGVDVVVTVMALGRQTGL